MGRGFGLVEEVGIAVGVGDSGDKVVGDEVFVARVGDAVRVGVGFGEEVGEIDEFGFISVVGAGVELGCDISRFNV